MYGICFKSWPVVAHVGGAPWSSSKAARFRVTSSALVRSKADFGSRARVKLRCTLNPRRSLLLLGLVAAPFTGCGPDHKPDEPCDGPTFNLVVTAEPGPLAPDTQINVRYGGNQEGERYALGDSRTPQAVFCVEDTTAGGARAVSEPAGGAAGAGGATSEAPADAGVQALRCRLYTQGPARLDVRGSGYTPIANQPLSLDGRQRCEITVAVVLMPEKPDAGK